MLYCPSCGTQMEEHAKDVVGDVYLYAWKEYQCPSCGDRWTVYSDPNEGTTMRKEA